MKILEKIKKKQNDIQNNPNVTIAFLGDSITQGCFELYKTGKEIVNSFYKKSFLRAILSIIWRK